MLPGFNSYCSEVFWLSIDFESTANSGLAFGSAFQHSKIIAETCAGISSRIGTLSPFLIESLISDGETS